MFKQRFVYLIVTFIPFFFSCKKADINFGGDYLYNESTQILGIDTFSVNLSTVYLDSLATNDKGTTLLGGYKDPIFGRIDTKCYFEMQPGTYDTDYDFPLKSTFDSLILILTLDNSYYGDTTTTLHINVNALGEKIAPPNNGYALYNNESFVATNLLGSKDLKVQPSRKPADTISIRLSDSLGLVFFNKLKKRSDLDLKSGTDFLNYFYGIQISSNGTGNLVLGCTDNITMRLHYKRPDIYNANKTFEFKSQNKNHHFNNIQVNRSGTVLQGLQAAREIPSTLSQNISYSQHLSGVMAKISFPTIRDLLLVPNYLKIVRAELVVRPVANSYNPYNYPLPPQIRLSSTNALNLPGTDLASNSGYLGGGLQTGNLTIDYFYGLNTYYSYDVTNYLKSIITDPTVNKNGLLLMPPTPAFETQMNRLVIGDTRKPQNNIQLQVYYLTAK